LCVIKKPRGRGGSSPRWAAEPEMMMMMMIIIIIIIIIMKLEKLRELRLTLKPGKTDISNTYFLFTVILKKINVGLKFLSTFAWEHARR
jgi:hypothetical protein